MRQQILTSLGHDHLDDATFLDMVSGKKNSNYEKIYNFDASQINIQTILQVLANSQSNTHISSAQKLKLRYPLESS